MLDSDTMSADSMLHVEFYLCDDGIYKGKPFIRIVVPGDKTNIIEQPVKDSHKERFPRQWLYFQMKTDDSPVIGTLIGEWREKAPEELSSNQVAELQILKFQTVEQIATASDAQLQRIGMGGQGLRERARQYLSRKNRSENSIELEKTRSELDELKAQMAELLAAKKLGRPRKEAEG